MDTSGATPENIEREFLCHVFLNTAKKLPLLINSRERIFSHRSAPRSSSHP